MAHTVTSLYVVALEMQSPDAMRSGYCDDDTVEITTTPQRTNGGDEPLLAGWLGTTGDCCRTAMGEFDLSVDSTIHEVASQALECLNGASIDESDIDDLAAALHQWVDDGCSDEPFTVGYQDEYEHVAARAVQTSKSASFAPSDPGMSTAGENGYESVVCYDVHCGYEDGHEPDEFDGEFNDWIALISEVATLLGHDVDTYDFITPGRKDGGEEYGYAGVGVKWVNSKPTFTAEQVADLYDWAWEYGVDLTPAKVAALFSV